MHCSGLRWIDEKFENSCSPASWWAGCPPYIRYIRLQFAPRKAPAGPLMPSKLRRSNRLNGPRQPFTFTQRNLCAGGVERTQQRANGGHFAVRRGGQLAAV